MLANRRLPRLYEANSISRPRLAPFLQTLTNLRTEGHANGLAGGQSYVAKLRR